MDNNNKELIQQEELFSLMHEWLKPVFDKCIAWYGHSITGDFGFSFNPFGDGIVMGFGIGSGLIDDHWEICNGSYKEENINIKIFNDHIEFIEDSAFIDFPIEEMRSLYEFLNERIFGIKEKEKKEKENVINNKELVPKEKLFSFVHEWSKPFIDKFKNLGGGWAISSGPGGFRWQLISITDGMGLPALTCEPGLIDDHWDIHNNILNRDDDEKYTNIRIFDDHMEFIEDSEFTDFTRDEMCSLYEFLNERIFGIKEDEDENENE